jgi:NAD(P)-dependent dehydrogenase (short-subunit alcohol dehydrogenase family)
VDIADRVVVILGGSGLVGSAIARRLVAQRPAKIVVGGLWEEEAREAVAALREVSGAVEIELVPEWGDIFVRRAHRGHSRDEILASEQLRKELVDDIFGELNEEAYSRSTILSLLERHRPDIVVDCINTATAIAYQELFASALRLRAEAAEKRVFAAEVEAHLTMLYLPQLIRHVQLLMEGMRRAGTKVYVKIGTSGTGGMGLNVPFTHSEERPSRSLLAKASVAGAQSLLLYLLARTPGAPVVKEIKPTAAIAWQGIGYGPVLRGQEPLARYDASRPVVLEEAFDRPPEEVCERIGGGLESVWLDAGENGLFSLAEFEAISELGMMEIITPEEIAQTALDEIVGRPTGRDIVAALDASSSGPTYRGGMMREAALRRMEELEREHGVRSIAFEMLGPPRLSKLLFEAAILRELLDDIWAAAQLEEEEIARRAAGLIENDADLRSSIVSIGIPILLPDGQHLLRGPEIKARPPSGEPLHSARSAARGWVDLRPASWVQWRKRCVAFIQDQVDGRGADRGSERDLDPRARSGQIRPGALAAFVFRTEDRGERAKR